MASVKLSALSKSYGQVAAVRAIDLAIEDQAFIVLIGPSGCGKSTTLRMIAGLETVSAGEIWIGDTVVNELEPKDRNIAMVFQDYALYPHMSVYDNMAFGLQYRGYKKDEIRRRVTTAAETLAITKLLKRRPKQLSGGQRQRVAMGRAIVREPKVFLFDEPLSNLDAKLRVQMRTEIKKLHQRVATTIIYVTHDQIEAMTLADRIVLMRDGVIEQTGSPDELYNHPCSTYVAGFIGAPTMNLATLHLTSINGQLSLCLDNQGAATMLPLPARFQSHLSDVSTNAPVIFGLRPEDFSWQQHAERPGITVTAEVVEPLGSDTLVFFTLADVNGDQEWVARVAPDVIRRAGEQLTLYPNLEKMHLFNASTQQSMDLFNDRQSLA